MTSTHHLNEMLIDSSLVNEISHFISQRVEEGFDASKAFTVEFSREGNFKKTDSKDSTILISTLNCDDIKANYKGVYFIKSYKVAFFDDTDFGHKFYDSSLLTNIPIDSLQCFDGRFVYVAVYVIKNGKMRLLW
jgi:hypothetical protein